jgi:hypothetical protein
MGARRDCLQQSITIMPAAMILVQTMTPDDREGLRAWQRPADLRVRAAAAAGPRWNGHAV